MVFVSDYGKTAIPCGKYLPGKKGKSTRNKAGCRFYFCPEKPHTMSNNTQGNFFTRLAEQISDLIGSLFVSGSSRDFQRLKNFIAS